MIQKLKNLSFDEIWLGIYGLGICVFPPIHFRNKTYFAAEWLLIPILAKFLNRVFRKQVRLPPKESLYVIGALILSFFAGMFRGEIATELSIYESLTVDHFELSIDFIRLVRWVIIFFTPWIISESFSRSLKSASASPSPPPPESGSGTGTGTGTGTGSGTGTASVWTPAPELMSTPPLVSAPQLVSTSENLQRCFLGGLLTGGALAAVAGILESLDLINLINLGYHPKGEFWIGRLYGTFPSPLEASVFFGGLFILCLSRFKTGMEFFLSLLFAVALVLSRGGTAMMAVCATVIILLWSKRLGTKSQQFFLIFILIGILAGSFIVFPQVRLKFASLVVRSVTWKRWILALPRNPWSLFTGIGYSGLVVDNSFLTLLIKGGLFLGISVFFWLQKLSMTIPSSFRFVFLFWILTWFSLDSIGYWAFGRIAWALLGIFYFTKEASSDAGSLEFLRERK